MRVLLWMLAFLATIAFAWEKEDHEIFDLVSAIEASEGKGTTFYSWLGVESSATTQEIAKAYRKLSMQLHPDKNPGNEKIQERFARLGVVSTILRKKESRKRYDFFHKNGVPAWRGTGYYYSRFRPGVGTVIVFMTLLTSALQYAIQGMNYKRDLERIEKFIREARLAAWGNNLVPVQGQRKVKVNLGGPRRIEDDGSPAPARTVDMLVDEENVYILDPSGDRHLLDTSAAEPASISRLWPVRVASNLIGLVSSRKGSENPTTGNEQLDETEDDASSTASEATNTSRLPVQSTKVGGRRRKVVKR